METTTAGSTLDWVLISVSGSLLLIYHVLYTWRLFTSPHRVSLGVNLIERTRWVRRMMTENVNQAEILAVQSLRNSMMAASFLSSTAFLGAIYTLNYWLNLTALRDAPDVTTYWQVRVMSLALVLFGSFFAFAVSMRMFSHASFLVGVRLPSPADLEALQRLDTDTDDDEAAINDLEGLDARSTVCCKIAWHSLMSRAARSHSHVHVVRSVLSLVGRATTSFFVGMRFLYLLIPFGGWVFFQSVGLLVGTVSTLSILFFSDFV